jgi:hypothetical protein
VFNPRIVHMAFVKENVAIEWAILASQFLLPILHACLSAVGILDVTVPMDLISPLSNN